MQNSATDFSWSHVLAGEPQRIQRHHCFGEPGWHVWCNSIVRDVKGRYHLFYCRWPKSSGYDAWVTHSEIARATAESLDEPFLPAGPVFRREESEAWDAHVFHNVTVCRFGGRFYLYYMGNRGNGEWWDHRNRQRIGVAVADSPEGPWIRFRQPVLDVSPGKWDALMVSNPTVCDTADGRFFMVYKGVGEGKPPFGGRVLHGVAWAEDPLGPFVKAPAPIMDLPGIQFGFEDPFIWREDAEFCGLIKDMNGHLSPSGESSLLLVRSTNGLHWHADTTRSVLGRELLFAGRGRERFLRVERPQVFWDEEDMMLWLLAAVRPAGESRLSYAVRMAYPV